MPLLDDPWLASDGAGNYLAWSRAPRVAVYRFDGVSTLDELPNVECMQIHQAEGTNPGHATFRYNLAMGGQLEGAPAYFEQALGTGFNGPYVVNAGDRLVVRAMRPDGVVENLFDGIVQQFSLDLDPDSEEVPLGAVGVAKRAWDDVIGGAIVRNTDEPRQITDIRTDIPAHFNPGGLPNCIPDGYMAGSQSSNGDFRYPTFLDPSVVRDPDRRTYWTLPKSVRYILYNANKDQRFVKNPSGDYLDALLVSPGAQGDRSAPIRCPDTPITGKDWPGTIYRMIADCGFGMAFGLNEVGDIMTGVNFFANQGGPLKKLYLAPPGTPFDPTLFNFNGGSLSRDVGDVANTVKVKGALTRWEASFVLAPGFPMDNTDDAANNLERYDEAHVDFKGLVRAKYRLYVFDETGEGHYAPGTSSKLATVPSLDGLLGKDHYCRRRRRPIGDLISVDSLEIGGKAVLWISRDYGGSKPGVWDETGTWQKVASGGWRLLEDRLGIEITEFPNNWQIGETSAFGMPYPSGVVRGVEDQSDTGGTNFYLRLTCVIEGDIALTQTAGPRANSALPYPVTRVVDASDRYRLDIVHKSSDFYEPTEDEDESDHALRDDSKAALAEAQAIRAGSEMGEFGGSVTLPWLTTYYKIGDRISEIEGRGLGLRTDGGSTEDAVFPVVIGRTFNLGGSQTTTLQLSDAGTLRSRQKRAPGRRHAKMGKGGARRGSSSLNEDPT